ncbi:unnamed protein product, partial [marine sediment metagenome]
EAFYSVGIFVFKDAFREPDYSGFCLFDEEFPIVFVNNSAAKTRQSFTLVHELAHLLFHTSGIDTYRNEYVEELPLKERRIEVFCNKFTAEFLAPEREFERAMGGLGVSEETAHILASHFRVSREFVYRRFLDRGLIDENTYSEATSRWTNQIRGGDGGNPYWTKIAYLGREYIHIALRQYHQNRINESQLAEYLGSKPRHLSTLTDYFERSAV